MKKRIFAVITICALVLTFASCKKEPITDTQQDKTPIVDSQENQNVEELPEPEYTIKTDPLTDTVSVKDTGELLFTKTVERVRITAQHTAYIDAAKKISTVMKRASERNENTAENIKNSALNAFTGEDMLGLPWSLDANYETISSGGKIVSLVEHVYYNAGSAYPFYADFSYNFDAKTGEQLFIDKLFPFDDDEKTMAFLDLIREKLENKYPNTIQEDKITTNL